MAKQAITEVLHRYCRGIDRMDRELAGTVWHPDGTADYGEGRYQGSGSGFLDHVWPQHAAMVSHSHQIGNILIEVDLTSATAGSESYVSLWARMPVSDGLVRDIFARCRYVDRWSRRDGRWAIDHRVTLYDLTRVTELPVGRDERPRPVLRQPGSFRSLLPRRLTFDASRASRNRFAHAARSLHHVRGRRPARSRSTARSMCRRRSLGGLDDAVVGPHRWVFRRPWRGRGRRLTRGRRR